MPKKNKPDTDGYVYSTDPGFRFNQEEQPDETPAPEKQILRVWVDTKLRAGKAATLVKGFIGKDADLEELGKKLKSFCGTGGSVKDGMIIVQGDQREKVIQWLLKNGYTGSKKAG